MTLPKINVCEWIAAEAEFHVVKPRPVGYITRREYAMARNIGLGRAQVVLKQLYDKGGVSREWWQHGAESCYVYKLKKNGREKK